MITEEEKKVREKDILFQIDMQLYDEFNDTLATMNDHLGDVYSLRDIEEVEKAEKDKEIKLLREAVSNLQKENEELENKIDTLIDEKIDTLIDEQEEKEKYTHNLEGKILILQKELDKKDICLKTCEESLTKERQERIKLDKVIEEMGIALMHNKNSRFYNMTLAEVEQYFYKKVEDKDE